MAERRQELEQIRSAPDGTDRIVAIYDRQPPSEPTPVLPASFVRRMIEDILSREFPEDR